MSKAAGATLLRGGAFKPRTSPYAFQGLGLRGLEILAAVRETTGLPIVTEVVDARDVPVVAAHADMLQVGTRNAGNFGLLQAVGECGKPVLLKRGMTATIEEWLMAAEYVAQRGNLDVVLCERGIRTFEPATRNTLDISAVPVVQATSHLPIIVDPSHAAGRKDLVVPLSRAAIAVGADGVIVDVHPNPEEALCDGPQALFGGDLRALATGGAAGSPRWWAGSTPANGSGRPHADDRASVTTMNGHDSSGRLRPARRASSSRIRSACRCRFAASDALSPTAVSPTRPCSVSELIMWKTTPTCRDWSKCSPCRATMSKRSSVLSARRRCDSRWSVATRCFSCPSGVRNRRCHPRSDRR